MKKFKNYSEVTDHLKYRIDILEGTYEGTYLFNDTWEILQFIPYIAIRAERGTYIYFLERIGDFKVYELKGRLKI